MMIHIIDNNIIKTFIPQNDIREITPNSVFNVILFKTIFCYRILFTRAAKKTTFEKETDFFVVRIRISQVIRL